MADPWRAEGGGAQSVPEPDLDPRHTRPSAALEPADADDDANRHWAGAGRVVAAWALVVPIAGWLAVRVAGAGGGTPIETYLAFTPYVGLASLAVLAVEVVALRVRAAVLVAAGCCLGYGLVAAPLFVPGPYPSPSPTGPELRVMTVNVDDGGADARAIVTMVREHDVDILGVPELTLAFHERLMQEGLDELLPHAAVGEPAGSAGTGLYSRPRIDGVAHDVQGAHDNPTAPIALDGARPVEITVVHPLPPVSDAARADWRRTFRSLPRPDLDGPVRVLLGDFNATVDQPIMRDLLGDGYVDAAGAVGAGWIPTWRRRLSPPLTIDHVLVDRSTAVDTVSVLDVPGSDHRAVVAELRLPSE